MRITAILASHDRRDQTLACLASYFEQELAAGNDLDAVLVDDGSTDGTADAVGKRFPAVDVIEGAGDLFWAGAMQVAERAAIQTTPDHLLWLNDDVVLDRDALSRLLAASESHDGCIAVGALRDPDTASLTYSGIVRRGIHPLRVDRVEPGERPVEVETFNGNAVLVPLRVARKVGPIDGALRHSAADFDYGLRALRAGVASVLASGTVGTCPANRDIDPWRDPSRPAGERLRLLFSPKGLPPRARARYLMRHGGPAWLLFWLASYVKALPGLARPSRGASTS